MSIAFRKLKMALLFFPTFISLQKPGLRSNSRSGKSSQKLLIMNFLWEARILFYGHNLQKALMAFLVALILIRGMMLNWKNHLPFQQPERLWFNFQQVMLMAICPTPYYMQEKEVTCKTRGTIIFS